jgi:dihydroorotate dehydrogenase electron transfer subunit
MMPRCDGLAPRLFSAEVVENRPLGGNGFAVGVFARDLEVRLSPGQFLQARAWEGDDPLLRRPVAPLDVRAAPGGTRIDLLVAATGRGTRLFRRLRPGDEMTLLGPLGRGFSPLPPGPAALVAGGVGVAPLYHLAREAVDSGRRKDLRVFLGARERALLFAAGAIEALGVETRIATDKGDAGFHGTAVEALERDLGAGFRPAVVLGCGPERMLEALVALVRREGLRCEVSLERRMACGFGVCMTCVCRAIDERTGTIRNVRTCIDGPVIDAARLPAGGW